MTARIPSQAVEGLLYALTVFGPLAFGCVEPWSVAVLEMLAFILALACFLRGRRTLPPMATWFWLIPASFAALGALQFLSAVAPDQPRPLWPFTAAASATQASVLLWASYAALLWSVPQVIANHEVARRYCRLLFGLGRVLAVQGMIQTATGTGKLYWLRPSELTAVFGPYYNRDHAANLLLMTMAVGIGIYFSKARRWPAVDGPPTEYVYSQGRLAGGVIILLAAIAVCASRGAFLAIPLAGAFIGFAGAGFAQRAHARRLRAAGALALAAFVIFFVFRLVAAGGDAGALTEQAVTQRFLIYGDGWAWLRDTPLFGTGLGSFETVYPSYQNMDLRALAVHAHSDWLELVLETGLAGLLAALGALALLVVGAVRAWHGAASSEMRALIGGALAATVAFVVHSLFEFSFQIPGNAVVFLGIVGFLLSAPLWKDKAAPRARPVAPSAWAALAAVGCFLGLARAVAAPAVEADPRHIRTLAAQIYSDEAVSEKPDAGALRAALGLSLAAAELRPFDYRALSISGKLLVRLGRVVDAGVFLERSRLVRFTPLIVGAGDTWARTDAHTIATLKSLGLPGGGAK